jgi:hypothetical protein
MRTIRHRLRRVARRSAIAAALAAGLLAPPPPAAQVSPLPREMPVLALDRVANRSGNNPFDARDPLARDARAAAANPR